ncbi:hypothetical protein AM500_05420 [Bacillus sp. FJAT-18017]|nr:hypothetical protein AM500_05420 [Bacillus sp. FJAT-18017]
MYETFPQNPLIHSGSPPPFTLLISTILSSLPACTQKRQPAFSLSLLMAFFINYGNNKVYIVKTKKNAEVRSCFVLVVVQKLKKTEDFVLHAVNQ